MNEELQTKLLEALQATINTISDIKDLAVEQLPDLLQQAITWYGIYYFIIFLSGLALAGIIYTATYYVVKKCFKHEKDDSVFTEFSTYYDKVVLTDTGIISLIAVGVLNIASPLAYLNLFNLQWLKNIHST